MLHDTKTAVMMYYRKPEIGIPDIKLLFDCSRSTAQKRKALADKRQKERGIISSSRRVVNTECAYQAWGIDIVELEKKYNKLKKLEKGDHHEK